MELRVSLECSKINDGQTRGNTMIDMNDILSTENVLPHSSQ